MPILQHSQPQSVQASSGITLPFHTVPTSQPHTTAHPSTEPLPLHQPISNIEGLPRSGTNPSRPASAHLSLYEQSRNPLPARPPSIPCQLATGPMSWSSAHRFNPNVTEDVGSELTGSSDQTHNLHQSYSRPLSCDMSTSPTRQAERAPSMSFHALQCHSPTRLPILMEYQSPMSRPPSRRSHTPTPTPLPPMTLPDAIQFYQRTATDLSVAIPEELKQAEYHKLYNHYAYELPFILT